MTAIVVLALAACILLPLPLRWLIPAVWEWRRERWARAVARSLRSRGEWDSVPKAVAYADAINRVAGKQFTTTTTGVGGETLKMGTRTFCPAPPPRPRRT